MPLEIQLYRDFSLSLSPPSFSSSSHLFLGKHQKDHLKRKQPEHGASDFYTKAETRVCHVISHYRTYFPAESHLDNREHCLKWRYLRAKYTDGNPDVPLFLSRAPFAPRFNEL